MTMTKIGDRDYRLIDSNPFGMMFRKFNNFDGMRFDKTLFFWTPFCIEMDLILIKDFKVIGKIRMKPFKIYKTKPHDFSIELNPNNTVKIGDIYST